MATAGSSQGEQDTEPVDKTNVKKEPLFPREPQLQKCRKPGCPVGKLPAGASCKAAMALKKSHITCLKRKFEEIENGESNMKVMPSADNSADLSHAISTVSDEKNKGK